MSGSAKHSLDSVTLLGVDCVDIDRLVFAAEVSQRHLRFHATRLLSHLSHPDADITPIAPITSKREYSTFVMKELYKHVDTPHVLIIQWDGFVLNPFAWTDAFLDYDYIGAPWPRHLCASLNLAEVGNGGFSLRSRRLLECVAALDGDCHPEDHVICRTHGEYLRSAGLTFSPEEVASRFSIEGGRWAGQFGFHQSNISAWQIERFIDIERHEKYLEMFHNRYVKGVRTVDDGGSSNPRGARSKRDEEDGCILQGLPDQPVP